MFKKFKDKVHQVTADKHEEESVYKQPPEDEEGEEEVQGDYEQEDDGEEQVGEEEEEEGEEAEGEEEEDGEYTHPTENDNSHLVGTNDDEYVGEEEEDETEAAPHSQFRAVVANEDGGEEVDDEDVPPVTPGKLARTTSDAITTADKQAASEKNHPPIKMYSSATDSGCDDDWISLDCVRELGLEDQVQEPDTDEVFTTFSGEEMAPAGTVYLTWVADSSSISNETCANVAEHGPFDFLVGNNFMQTYGDKAFSEPVLILRARKPQSGAQTEASKKAHEQRLASAKEAAQKISAAREQEDAELPEDEEGDTSGVAARTSKLKVSRYEDDEE